MNGAVNVSVVIPAYESHEVLPGCLAALERQTVRPSEVVVVDSSPDPAPTRRVIGSRPGLRLVGSPRRLLPHAARNLGVERTSGSLIVFTDPDCRPQTDWLERLLESRDAGHELIAGAVESGGGGVFDRGVHLCKFTVWIQGPEGERDDAASANLACSRRVWEHVGPLPGEFWAGDTALCWRARAAGFPVRFQPAAVVEHVHEQAGWSFLRERAVRGADYARLRAISDRWSRARAGAHALGAPLVPFVLLARSLRRSAAAGRLREALPTVPVQLAGFAAWSAGEATQHLRLLVRGHP